MTRFLIGTGGWAYFQVPNVHPLVAYSKAFKFVEVNSTFYEIPDLKMVKSWRKMVPSAFEFSVRCNQEITHNLRFQLVPQAYEILEKMIAICKVLNAEFLHFQTPPSFQPNKTYNERIKDFFSTAKLGEIRPVLEVRSKSSLGSNFIETLRDMNIIHSVDLLKGDQLAYRSDILYTRLFGKGYHNIYQPLDNELKEVARVASQGNFKKAAITMHSNRMFKDAARLLLYEETGSFPMVTKSTGIDSLAEVLKEDAKFPSTRRELVRDQGWKVIDLSKEERVRASFLLNKLPDKTYYDTNEIVKVLEDQ
ncbi:MAG: DUF72 domain-containing protein [Candidatus Bathyarchaeum sp.]|nr:MAG: DUF72 domain-containing protein [Candidatus Bathyarchaeum sp.]